VPEFEHSRWLNVRKFQLAHQSSRFTNFVEPATPVWAAITVFSLNFNIMSNLDLVVELYSFSDNCRTHCSINRRTTDIYIIFNNYIPIWGILVRSIRIWCKTKTIWTDNSPRMNRAIVTYNSLWVNFCSSKQQCIVADYIISIKQLGIFLSPKITLLPT
jgi:hypothetical protein